MIESKLTPTVEDYLQAMYGLEKKGEMVITARLARRMGVTPPTAWATVRRMARDGLVKVGPKKVVSLTEQGWSSAEDTIRRHRLSERFLTDILGLSWVEVHEEAHRFEHALTPRLEERIVAILGNPTHCPHGSPIPGTEGEIAPDLMALKDLAQGARATVEFISEELESNLDILRYLERGRLMPGQSIVVKEVAPSSGVVVVESNGQTVPLGLSVAADIWVRAAGQVRSAKDSQPVSP